MFALTHRSIDAVVESLPAGGGYVVFEGRVRDHAEGRAVLGLEYEAYEPLAVSEGRAILAEALARFDILDVRAIHRVGRLQIGDIAVWIAVSAAHRVEAFAACRYAIDEIKKRVPIWKREIYSDGDAAWVNAQGPSHRFTPEAFYARQTVLPHVGQEGQIRLSRARVLVVGAGGLGCPALLYLAAAGVGQIIVCDGDTVSVDNLHRQVLFGIDDCGRSKAWVAASRLRALNPFIHVEAVEHALVERNAEALVDAADLVLDCTDNFTTKFLLNDTCVRAGKVLVQASIHQFEGQIQVIDPARGGPCLRCIWHERPDEGCVGTCAETGVLGFVPGVFGTLQACEAIKVVLGIGEPAVTSTVLLDLRFLELIRISRSRRPGCPACGSGKAIESLEIRVDELEEGMILVDMREASLRGPVPALGAAAFRWLTEEEFRTSIEDSSKLHVLVCSRGVTSARVARALRDQGFDNVRSLVGGVLGLSG